MDAAMAPPLKRRKFTSSSSEEVIPLDNSTVTPESSIGHAGNHVHTHSSHAPTRTLSDEREKYWTPKKQHPVVGGIAEFKVLVPRQGTVASSASITSTASSVVVSASSHITASGVTSATLSSVSISSASTPADTVPAGVTTSPTTYISQTSLNSSTLSATTTSTSSNDTTMSSTSTSSTGMPTMTPPANLTRSGMSQCCFRCMLLFSNISNSHDLHRRRYNYYITDDTQFRKQLDVDDVDFLGTALLLHTE